MTQGKLSDINYKVWIQLEKIVTSKGGHKDNPQNRSSYENVGPPVELLDTNDFEDANSFLADVERFSNEIDDSEVGSVPGLYNTP
ncbi:hypothetical protein LCGC14_0311270 [marine sediment metagenome]|uniref:Uncharacterized protein n=1 Tax=marine sediment metagenome TaxID=412755 RepID=A0A0F9TSM2_9ZZZZ